MKRLILIIAVLLLPLFGDELKEIKDDLQKRVNDITALIADKSMTLEAKNQKIMERVDSVLDFELMARLSLEKSDRQKLSDEQLKEFNKLFEKELKDSFLEKLKNYSDEKIFLRDAVKTKQDRVSAPSVIHSKNGDTEVVFKYYLTKDSTWKIYDLEIAGVSLLQSYRTQFSEVMTSSGAEKLFEKLRKKQ